MHPLTPLQEAGHLPGPLNSMMTQLVQDSAVAAEAVVALVADIVVALAVEAVAVVVTVVVVQGFVEGAVLARFLGFPVPPIRY